MKLAAAEHEAISAHCVEALDGYYDQHVFEVMHFHDGAGLLARQAEDAAARAARASRPARRSRRNDDPLGLFAALRRVRRA